jgi:hypothetical protein
MEGEARRAGGVTGRDAEMNMIRGALIAVLLSILTTAPASGQT